jgi:hypothetical protein
LSLGYQFGLIGRRQIVLSSLLLLMWSGGMILVADLNLPRSGQIAADVAPLIAVIEGFRSK